MMVFASACRVVSSRQAAAPAAALIFCTAQTTNMTLAINSDTVAHRGTSHYSVSRTSRNPTLLLR